MSRGRHAKPSGLLSRLFPGRAARRRAAAEAERALLRELRHEVDRAEEQARAARAEVHDLRVETDSLRSEVARLREEVLWAWADERMPAQPAAQEPVAQVIDLREASAG